MFNIIVSTIKKARMCNCVYGERRHYEYILKPRRRRAEKFGKHWFSPTAKMMWYLEPVHNVAYPFKYVDSSKQRYYTSSESPIPQDSNLIISHITQDSRLKTTQHTRSGAVSSLANCVNTSLPHQWARQPCGSAG